VLHSLGGQSKDTEIDGTLRMKWANKTHKQSLKISYDGKLQLELLGFQTLSIVYYSEKENTMFREWDLLLSSCKKVEYSPPKWDR